MHSYITPLILLLLLSACSAAEENSTPKDDKTTKKTHLLSEQERMIQKAKDAEKLIKEAAEKQRKAIEDASK